MKIQTISHLEPCNKVSQNKSNYIKSGSLQNDAVSFQGGVSVSLILYVVKEGYNGLKNNSAKAKFKSQIAQRIASPDLSGDGKNLADVLFALAKTKGKDEPRKNIIYSIKDKYSMISLEELRSSAIGKLFPLIPVRKNDRNYGNAAKEAMLGSMIDTGEYLYCPYTYQAYKSLFNESDKESLLLRALRNKNVWQEIDLTYTKPKAKEQAEKSYKSPDIHYKDTLLNFCKIMFYHLPKDLIDQAKYIKKEKVRILPMVQKDMEVEKAIVNTALFGTLDPNKHEDFFINYGELLTQQSTTAFSEIVKRLKTDKNGEAKSNELFTKYANCFENMSIPQEALAIRYIKDLINYHKYDINNLSKEFNINRNLCQELCKDINLISEAQDSESLSKDIITQYEKRIKEKMSSNIAEIRQSAGTLVYLSGHANKLKSILDTEKEKLKDARFLLNKKLGENNSVYGCNKPYIPTLAELEAKDEKVLEEQNYSFSDADVDYMEVNARLSFM